MISTMVGQNSLSAEDIELIDSKLKERFSFKRERYYDDADAIRDELKEKFGVNIDDRTKEWTVESVAEYSVSEGGEASDDYTVDDEELDKALEAMLGDDDDEDDSEESDDVEEDDAEEEIEITAEEEEVEEDAEEGVTKEDLSGLTVPLLKEKLKAAGLPVSGKKAELIERLLA